MYCEQCNYWKDVGYAIICTNPHFFEDWPPWGISPVNSLRYSYAEGGYFAPGPKFGCVHFEKGLKEQIMAKVLITLEAKGLSGSGKSITLGLIKHLLEPLGLACEIYDVAHTMKIVGETHLKGGKNYNN